MKRIWRRALAVLPAVLLQAAWLYVLFWWLSPWAVPISAALSVLALLGVLYIITRQQESTYKILWLLVILPFPLAGALLYLLFGDRRTGRPLKKKLAAAGSLPPPPEGTAAVYESLAKENPRLCQTFRCVEKQTGLAPCFAQDVKYYPLGDEMFPDMLEALKSAQSFIFVEYFILENGLMWDSMTDIMAKKAAQGVDVRVLYDDLGSISTYTKQDVARLKKRGIRCVAFNPLVFIKGTLNCRDHRKMLIVDGKTAFSGGVNLADEYINHIQRFGHWKDIGFRLRGAAVANYVNMFVQFWNAFGSGHLPPVQLPAPEDGAAGPAGGYVLSYYDSPLREEAVSNELYVDLLAQAQQTAWFFTPYLMPGNALLDAFVRAARRGVDVRILLPGIPDKKLIYRMSRSFYPVLLDAGVKIYEYTPGFVHAKACLVDGVVGTVGTVNLDYRSLFLHFENNSLFYRVPLLADLQADLLATQEKCVQRTRQDIGDGFGKWLVDGVLRTFAPLC